MKYLQIFVISLLIALSLAQRERKGGFRNKKFPRPPKQCSTDGDCPNTATCLKPESRPNGICVPKKKADMFKKMTSELRGCSADSDCEGAEKCKEMPKVGVNMCMSEALTKMLQMKVARLPGVPKTCVSESDCTGTAKCVDFPKFNKQLCLVEDRHLHRMLMIIHQNFEVKDKDNLGINENKKKDSEDTKDKDSGEDFDKKTDMFKTMASKLRGCSKDSDCEGAEKCKEMPKVGINMCMSEALTKMLEKKVARLPGVQKTCVSESDCTGAAKCVDFPKFNKQLCLVEDRHLHRMLMILHKNFEVKDKDNLGINENKEKDGEDNKDKDSGVEDFDEKTDDSKKDLNYGKDNVDLFISDPQLIKRKNEDLFISDPQFLKRKHGDKGEFGFSKSVDGHQMRNDPWRMFFLGALAMTGIVIIMLTVVMCCLKLRKRSLPGDATEEQDTKRNYLRHNAFLTKISTVSHNPYSKLHNEKV